MCGRRDGTARMGADGVLVLPRFAQLRRDHERDNEDCPIHPWVLSWGRRARRDQDCWKGGLAGGTGLKGGLG